MRAAVARFSRNNPSLVALGGSTPLLDKVDLGQGNATEPRPVIDVLARRIGREQALGFLETSRRPGVQHILQNRNLTNTVHFPVATTSGGQALEAAILSAGLLNQGDYFSPSFRDAFEWLSMRANKGDNSGSLELVYLDLLSLGRRLDWVSLTELMKQVESLATLRDLAEAIRSNENSPANIFSAALLPGQVGGVAKYLARFPETGVNDINFALRNGRGAVELLVKQQQRVYYPRVRNQVTGYNPFGAVFFGFFPTVVASHSIALLLKYTFLLLAAFCIAHGIGIITSAFGIQLGARLAADGVFAFVLAFVVAVAIEPFLGLPSQAPEFAIRFQIPNLAATAGLKLEPLTTSQMNKLSLVSLIVFFVIQVLIYVWCLTKLAEIRRQPLAAQMKLKLIENEDLLFDAGLYVGFVGSVLSLILMSIGVGKISMMAYASTSFGIIFVSVLKIFHVRPLRRHLIMESELQP
ncbi:MAG: hypothetical protein EXS36_12480 [Pedosphaera sp.]|nr:hypothetical protein [Pedosphaera sp.]